ncbi:hypothetical protein BKA93DRAFT_750928 [Sparassis latifolia]
MTLTLPPLCNHYLPPGPTGSSPVDDNFFCAAYPETDAEYQDFCLRREQDAKAWAPYKDVPFTGKVVDRWPRHLGVELVLSCLHEDVSPDHHPVPDNVRSSAFTHKDCKITLSRAHPLQTGLRKWSQDVQVAPVVMKMFQQSLFPEPWEFIPDGDNWGIDGEEWLTRAQQARREA